MALAARGSLPFLGWLLGGGSAQLGDERGLVWAQPATVPLSLPEKLAGSPLRSAQASGAREQDWRGLAVLPRSHLQTEQARPPQKTWPNLP